MELSFHPPCCTRRPVASSQSSMALGFRTQAAVTQSSRILPLRPSVSIALRSAAAVAVALSTVSASFS